MILETLLKNKPDKGFYIMFLQSINIVIKQLNCEGKVIPERDDHMSDSIFETKVNVSSLALRCKWEGNSGQFSQYFVKRFSSDPSSCLNIIVIMASLSWDHFYMKTTLSSSWHPCLGTIFI